MVCSLTTVGKQGVWQTLKSQRNGTSLTYYVMGGIGNEIQSTLAYLLYLGTESKSRGLWLDCS